MPKKKSAEPKVRFPRKLVMRTAEALVEVGPDYACAEPEIVIGELDGPVGTAMATLLGDQARGHSKVFAILNSDVQVKPATLMVSKVTVNNSKYTNILMGSVQAGIANGVLDAVREGIIPKNRAEDLGIIIAVWLDPSVVDVEVDHKLLFDSNRQATTKAIRKAIAGEPSIDWLLKHQSEVSHFYHQLGVEGKL